MSGFILILPPYAEREKKPSEYCNFFLHFCRRRELNPGRQLSKQVRYPLHHCPSARRSYNKMNKSGDNLQRQEKKNIGHYWHKEKEAAAAFICFCQSVAFKDRREAGKPREKAVNESTLLVLIRFADLIAKSTIRLISHLSDALSLALSLSLSFSFFLWLSFLVISSIQTLSWLIYLSCLDL